jgi:pimeloyl-ACP methyl ester carboxylesterase
VHALTPPGMGDRRSELTSDIGLESFIHDVGQTLEVQDLRDVVLVGHSFGGIVISGVVDRYSERIRSLVYLDSLILFDGQSAYEVLDQDVRDAIDHILLEKSTDVPVLPVPIGHDFGVADQQALEWMRPQLSPHPVRTYRDRLHLDHPLGAGIPGVYLDCVRPPSLRLSAVKARTLPLLPWPVLALETGHDAMISDPELVATVLSQIAREEELTQ